MTLRIGSLCSGYEGLGMAVQSVLGGELAWVADNDPGASAILAHRYPGVPNLDDITAVDWSAVEPVDILCAGTPCQDVSQAGARAGLKAGTRSGVWLEAVRAIAVLQPRLVLIENVRGLLSARGDDPTAEHLRAEAARDVTARLLDWLENEQAIALAKGDVRRVRECRKRTARVMGLRKRAVARCQWHERRLVRAIGTVLGSLASLGFDAEGVVVSAAEAGAPHQRDRVFILAWLAADTRGRELQRRGIPRVLGSAPTGELGEGNQRERTGNAAGNGSPAAEDADSAASGERRQPAPGQAAGWRARADAGGSGGAPVAADPCGAGLEVRAVESDRHERPPAERGRGDDAPADADGQDAGPYAGGSGSAASAGPGDGPERRREPGPGVGGGAPADADLAGREGGEPARRQFVSARGAAADAQGDGRDEGRDEGRPEPAGIIGGPDAAERGNEPEQCPDNANRWHTPDGYCTSLRPSEIPCPGCGCPDDFHDSGGFCAGPCGGNCTDPVLGRPDGGWNSFEDDADPADVRAYALAHSKGIRHGHAGAQGQRGIPAAAVPGAPADADSGRLAELAECDGGTLTRIDGPLWDDAERCGEAAADADGSGRRLDGRRGRQGCEGQQLGLRPAEHQPGNIAWGNYEPAIRRWEAVLGRPAPRPTEPGRTGERLSPRFVEFLMGLPEGWVTDVPGLSRNAQLKALGNGVVPAQAAMALRLLLERSGLLPLVAADLTSAEGGEAA